MWKDTNFGAQRQEVENAGLSVGLMYGNGGGQAASTAGGTATQPSGPKMNPVEAALQYKQIEQQDYAYRDWETDRKSTRLNSSHRSLSRMPSSA